MAKEFLDIGRLGHLAPPTLEWDDPLGSVTAEPVGRSFMTRGVLLRAPTKPPANFWCVTRDQQRDVLSGFEAHK